MYAFYNIPVDNYTAEYLKNALSPYNRTNAINIFYIMQNFLNKIIQEGTTKNIKEDVLDVLSIDYTSYFIENNLLNIENLMAMALLLAFRLHDGHVEVAKVLKKIFQKKRYISKRDNFDKYQHISYTNICINQNNQCYLDPDFSKIQLCEAFDENDLTDEAYVVRVLWAEGIYYEIKNYICTYKKADPSLIEILQLSLSTFSKPFRDNYADCFFNEIGLIDTKGDDFCHLTLPLYHVVKLFISSKNIEDSYFASIIKTLNSEHYEKGKDEILYIVRAEEIQDYELLKLSELFEELITNYRNEYSEIIESLLLFLNSKEIISYSRSLYDKMKSNISLCAKLFTYIEPYFDSTIIDDTYKNGDFTSDTADFIVKVLETGKYESNQMYLIFLEFLKLRKSKYLMLIKKFSNQDKYKTAIFNSLKKYIIENDISSDNISEICSLLNTFTLSEQEDHSVLEKLSSTILASLDSIEILPFFRDYKFLIINDLPYFVDLAPHNYLFYKILIEKNISNFDDVIDDIIVFDEEDAFDCKPYRDFLFKAYQDTNETKFLFKLIEITNDVDFNNNATSNEMNQVFTAFKHYLQNTENKGEIVETIVKKLQSNHDNSCLKHLLVTIPNLKELFNFPDQEQINNITSNLTLSDDSLAFIASIGGNVSEEQLDSLFNSSNNAYPSYIVASLFPTELLKYTDDQKLEVYQLGCLVKSYILCKALINSVSSLINNKDTYNVCILNTSSEIADLTIRALPILDIFYNVDHVQPFITELINSEYTNFDLVFSAYLSKLNASDRAICTAVWNTYFSESFPPLYRTERNNYELFKLLSNSTSTFCDLISEVYDQSYSLYRPSVSLNLYQMFSSTPSIFQKIPNHSILYVFYKLLFSYESKISETFPDISINDFVKIASIPNQVIESVSFSNKKEFFSDTILLVEPKVSILNSFLQYRGNHVFLKTPNILIIQISGKIPPDFVIDDELDLSPYCLKTTKFELSSVGCEGNVAFLKQPGTNKYLKCTPKEVTCVDKIDPNSVTLVIYEKVNYPEKVLHTKCLRKFWQKEITNSVKVINRNAAILRCLQSNSIDWSLFAQTDDFFKAATQLIKIGVKNVFISLSSSTAFAEKFLVDEFGELVADKNFVDKYKDEIKKLTKAYTLPPIFIFWTACENMNLNNIDLLFDLVNSDETIVNDFDNRIEIIKTMKEDLIDTPQFEKFFVETIKMPECNKEFIDEQIKSIPALIPLMLKVSKQEYFELYSNMIDVRQFTSIVNDFDPDFVIYVLKQCVEKRSEFLPIAIKKLKGNQQFDDYLNHLKPEEININEIKAFYLAGEINLANSLLESKYPSQTTVKQDDAKKMLNELLMKSIQQIDKNISFSISIIKVITKYYKIFENDPDVTAHFIEFVFRGKQQIEPYLTEFIKLIELLSPVDWTKFIRLFVNLYPLLASFVNYRIIYKKQISLFALIVVSRIIKNTPGYISNDLNEDRLQSVLSAILANIGDKKLFVDTIISSFSHVINDIHSFSAYTRDLSHFPYIFLKMLELSADCDYWSTEYGLLFIKNTLSAIRCIYNNKMHSDHVFYLNKESSNSQTDQVSISLMEFVSKQIEKAFLDPESNIRINSTDVINIVMTDIKEIYIEKLNDNVKCAFFKLLEKVAYIYPLYTEQVLNYIIKDKDNINMYKRINDRQIRKDYTKFVLNLFREIIGDREFVQSANDERFKKAIILLKSQFARLLLTKDFTYEEVSPYIMVLMSFFKSKNQEFVKAFVDKLKPFPYVFYLLYTKEIKVDKTDNSSKINLLLMNFITKAAFDNPYPGIIVQFVKELKDNDPQLEQKINVLSCILKSKQMLNYQDFIITHCFNEFEKIALKRMNDIPKVKDLFNLFILKMGLEY